MAQAVQDHVSAIAHRAPDDGFGGRRKWIDLVDGHGPHHVRRKSVMRELSGPRYRFCWWCNRQLRANFYRAMRPTDDPDDFDAVIVHARCAAIMEREERWEAVSDPTLLSGADVHSVG